MGAELVDVVVSALSAGAVAGVKDTAGTAVKDAYAGLLALLRRRWGHAQVDAVVALEPAELRRALTEADVVVDEEIVAAARQVLQAGKYTVDIHESTGVQVGDGNTMTLHVNK
ncbi:MAG TPA: hypothetical protein VFX16_25325 [Pseudonocardiaceae bacterium]|nr:hypothetical protein [Pseudonocardiaceae bacterium]